MHWAGAGQDRTPEQSGTGTAETREIALKRQEVDVNTNTSGGSERVRESVSEGINGEREAGRGAVSRGRG